METGEQRRRPAGSAGDGEQATEAMARGVVHDLQNALATLLMVITHPGLTTGGASESLIALGEKAAREAVTLADLVLELPAATRGEETLVDLRYLFRQIERLVRARQDGALSFESRVDELGPITCVGQELFRILRELVVDVAGGGETGTNLRLSASSMEMTDEGRAVDGVPPGSYAVITIKSEGERPQESEVALERVREEIADWGWVVGADRDESHRQTLRLYLPG